MPDPARVRLPRRLRHSSPGQTRTGSGDGTKAERCWPRASQASLPAAGLAASTTPSLIGDGGAVHTDPVRGLDELRRA